MPQIFQFHEIARIPLPGDNVAIATHRLEADTKIIYEGRELTLDYTILEGHRFLLAWRYEISNRAPMSAMLTCSKPSGFARLILSCPPRPTLPTKSSLITWMKRVFARPGRFPFMSSHGRLWAIAGVPSEGWEPETTLSC